MTNHTPLPYNFDTRTHGRVLVKILMLSLIGLLAVAMVMRHFMADSLLPFFVLPIAIMDGALAVIAFRAAGGASGTVGRVHVTIEPDRMFGITTRSHQGTFPITEFAGFALSRIGAQGRLGVLRIIGKAPKLQITLAVAPYDTIKAEAQSMAEQLALPLKEVTP